MDNDWIKIYEVKDYKINTSIWLEDFLKNDNIPYKNEIEEYWLGIRIPKYKQRLKVFIPKKYEKIVKEYIKEYENPKSLDVKNVEELKNVNETENDAEIEKFNKIRKRFFRYWMYFLIMVIVLSIVATIIK